MKQQGLGTKCESMATLQSLVSPQLTIPSHQENLIQPSAIFHSISIRKVSQSIKKCGLHCRSEEPITTSSKSLSKSVNCKASKKSLLQGMPFQQDLTTYRELSKMDDHDHYVSIIQVVNGCVLHTSHKNKKVILSILD